MLHQVKITIDPKSRQKILQAIGNNTDNFYLKIARLRCKWTSVIERGIGDCHEARIVSPVIFGELTPINASIIADNLEFFKKIMCHLLR